jgi:hypothetical protein
MAYIKLSPKEKQGQYMFNLIRCDVKIPLMNYDEDMLCVEVP